MAGRPMNEDAQRARRPLLRVVAALVVGACAGRALQPSGWALALALSAAAGAWLAARGCASDGGPRGARPRVTTLVALALLSAARATTPPLTDARAPLLEGRWEPSRRTERGVAGRLVGAHGEREWLELPWHAAAAGDWLRVSPVGRPTQPAAGPRAAPHAPGEARAPRSWSVRSDEVERLGRAPPWEESYAGLTALRDALGRRCEVFARGAPRGLAQALLLGDTASLDPALGDLFTRTGLRHVLAVSGMHVALLAALVLTPLLASLSLRARGPAAVLTMLAVALGVAVYVVLTGSQAPVRRAGIALASSLAAPLLARRALADGTRVPLRVDTLSLWCFALCVEMVLEPVALFSSSLQLSYVATLGLILGTQPVARLLRGALAGRRRPRLGATTLFDGARAAFGRGMRASIAASIAAVLATLPLIWSSFGEWSPIGVLATPLTMPLVAWLMVYGWVALLAPALAPAAAFDAPARWFVSMLEVCDTLPGTPDVLPPRPLLLTAAVIVLAAFAVARASPLRELGRRRAARASALLASLALAPWSLAPRALELVALDVGSGTAVALRAPGQPVWIFDAGSRDRSRTATAALAPLLAYWEASEVAVALSHDERDHTAALRWLVERYPVRTWVGALPAPLAERLPHTCARIDPAHGAVRIGERAPAAFRVSAVRGLDEAGNEGSTALRIGWGPDELLLLGDAVEAGLERVLEALGEPLTARLVLWPHHGDDTPLAQALLAATRPCEVWISAAPGAAIEAELTRLGLTWRSTGRGGALTLALPPPAPGSWHGLR